MLYVMHELSIFFVYLLNVSMLITHNTGFSHDIFIHVHIYLDHIRPPLPSSPSSTSAFLPTEPYFCFVCVRKT